MSVPDNTTPSDLDTRYICSRHPIAFRSGEWAQIVSDDEVNGRPCWLVVFDDGVTDVWVKDDLMADYVFSRNG